MLIRQAKQTIYCEESYLKVEYQENQSTVMFCLGRYSGNIIESSIILWKIYLERIHLPMTNLTLTSPAHEALEHEGEKSCKVDDILQVFQLVDPNVHQNGLTAKGLSSSKVK